MSKIKTKGFTIVELLIVIVVIGVLAAITIVAYNGIQQRARNAQVISGTQTYIKALGLYFADKGQYPLNAGAVCLGGGYPADQCWTGTNGTRTVSSTFDTNLSEFLSVKPILATKLLQATTAPSPDMRAGASFNLATRQLVFYLEGANQNCSISGAAAANELQTTQCILFLPAS